MPKFLNGGQTKDCLRDPIIEFSVNQQTTKGGFGRLIAAAARGRIGPAAGADRPVRMAGASKASSSYDWRVMVAL
jgi:hypothetical protein